MATWREKFEELSAENERQTELWAAVSHALQYKREGDVPVQLRRKLFRLAGLFELADEQFVAIRNERNAVVERSREAVRDEMPGLRVDAPVLTEFLNTSEQLGKVIAKLNEMPTIDVTDDVDTDFVGYLVEDLERLGIATVDDLREILSKDYTAFVANAAGKMEWGMSKAFALQLMLIASNAGDFSIDELLKRDWHETVASRVIKAARKYGPA